MSFFLLNPLLKNGFSPVDLVSLGLWYDFSDASTITESGGFISQVDDKSSNNNHAVQAVGGDQPIYNTTTLNGLNTALFNVSKFMTSLNSITFDGNITVFIVFNNMGTVGINNNFFRASTNAGAVTYINSTSSNRYAMFNGAVLQSSTVASNDTAILTSVFNGVNSELKRNGVQIASGNTGVLSVTQTLQLANDFTNGEIAEFIFYNRVLSSSEILKIENYLSNKWGI